MKKILEGFADKVAEQFIDSDVSLDSSITDIAKNNNLNIEQIKRLCEMANKAVQLRMYSIEPLMQFDLANAKNVIKSLNIENAPPSIPTVMPSTAPSTDLITEFMKKYGPGSDFKAPMKMTIIMIKKTAKTLDEQDRKLASQELNLRKEAERVDLDLRHQIKIAMFNGTYPALIRAAYETLDRPGMKYVIEKIGFWKKKHAYCRDPQKVRGVLNKNHKFVQGITKLSELQHELYKVAVKRRANTIAKEKIQKIYELQKAPPGSTKVKKEVNKSPTMVPYKQG